MNTNWQYSSIHNSVCRVIEEQKLWDKTICRIWLPGSDSVVQVPKAVLYPISDTINQDKEKSRIIYTATAAKVADVLEGSSIDSDEHILIAPMESNVIPLPHQIYTLSRAISKDRIRYLLADEVGLGKTIEAGLILKELKLRGLVRRVLVIAPKGIATQWVSEMRTHFNEKFQLILGEDIKTLKRIDTLKDSEVEDFYKASVHTHSTANPWSLFDQVIVSLDSVKPIDKRKGWSKEKIKAYNSERFEDLITAGWDLIIVDESHRLGGSTDQVARYKLGKGLAEAAPYLLLLSATPHQGKTEAFHRLMSLLDSDDFLNIESITKEKVAPYTIRTEKRNAIDADGNALFKPRVTKMVPVGWEARHQSQQLLYEAVTDYVREGYNQAIKEKKHHVGFLMILLQRLVVSSTSAIRTTLERRLDVLENQTQILDGHLNDGINSNLDLETIHDMDAQELLEELLESNLAALKNEVEQVKSLLKSAIDTEQINPDAKAECLIDWIYRLQAEESDSDLKILIFTEFVPTQAMLLQFLSDRGISAVILNGSMSMEERRLAQNAFREESRVLISTDAGGEGLNLQFCNIVINYDIPWNPMKLEQRIGRVDRIGQSRIVKAVNFVFEESVEFRVREVLEEKLSIIYQEFGIDKTGDVLDSAQAGAMFEDVFTSALIDPDSVEQKVEETVEQIKQEIEEIHEDDSVYGVSHIPDKETAEKLRSHPLPHWLERMTTSYIESHGGKVTRKQNWTDLNWPDGTTQTKVVFNSSKAERYNANLLNLENPKIRGLALNLMPVAPGQPVPSVRFKNLPDGIAGYWGLYEIRLSTTPLAAHSKIRIPKIKRQFFSVFTNEDGKVFLPSARHVWNCIDDSDMELIGQLTSDESLQSFEWLQVVAEDVGADLFKQLTLSHQETIAKEKERLEYAYEFRKKVIDRIGLPEVRDYRLKKLKIEREEWTGELKILQDVIPDLRPLLILKILAGGLNG
jgi:superfamily II DNA or RNA helicase